MDYNIYDKNYREKNDVLGIIYEAYSDEIDREIETIYNKSEAWDRMCEMLKYKEIDDEDFIREMMELFIRTDKPFKEKEVDFEEELCCVIVGKKMECITGKMKIALESI
ncbi:hypothetical protein [Staphylococcus phage vB_SsapH-Golestan-105-M]|nr:hypothetical protein [Staphylococcus phage vB_SsapH-Golestan-105-M]